MCRFVRGYPLYFHRITSSQGINRILWESLLTILMTIILYVSVLVRWWSFSNPQCLLVSRSPALKGSLEVSGSSQEVSKSRDYDSEWSRVLGVWKCRDLRNPICFEKILCIDSVHDDCTLHFHSYLKQSFMKKVGTLSHFWTLEKN